MKKGVGSWLDFGARFYDPSIARFTTVDPLADQFPSHSPYSYTFNNPLIFTDPTGMAPETIYKNKDNPEETVEVNDGVDKTIEVSDTDFEKAKDFASNINGQLEENGVVEYVDVVDYENFYNEHNSYDLSEGSFLENASSLYDYAFGGPDIPSNLAAGTVPGVGPGKALKGYKHAKTIGEKYDVFEKTVKSKKLGGQARAVYTKIKNQAGETVRYFKDAYKRDGRHYERANKYPHKSRTRKRD